MCQIVPRLDEGGVERNAVDVAVAVVKAGGRALIVSEGGRLVPELLRSGGEHLEMKLATGGTLARHWLGFKLGRILRQDGFTLVHAFTLATTALGATAARRAGARMVATCHGLVQQEQGDSRNWWKPVASAMRVIAASDHVAARLVNEHGLDADRVVTIPPGINLARFNPAAVKADRFIKLAQRWLLPDGVPLILMPSRLVRDKGHLGLIEALTHLENQPFICLLAGDETVDDGYRAEVEAAITAKGLAGKVRLVGYCEDMPAAYMLADVVVTPDVVSGAFNRVGAEALAMGRPVIVSDS
ncbi:MAG: glycosyltransferase, partial [Alphaproteobacteria bacterium]